MRKFFGFLILMTFSCMVFAQDGDAGAQIGSTFLTDFSMAFAAGFCALGMGRAIGAACDGTARNPGAAQDIRTTMIIGLALIESLAIYALVIAIF